MVDQRGRGMISADAQTAARSHYDIAVVGAGVLGSALAISLARSGRRVVVLERDLSIPDRIVGELLQPGGCISLKKLGLGHTLHGIEATKVDGYAVFWGGKSVPIPYPDQFVHMEWEKSATPQEIRQAKTLQQGRSFHHGRFVNSLRQEAAKTENLTLVEATVNEFIYKNKVIAGVTATPKKSSEQLTFNAHLTIVVDGCFSKFRKTLIPNSNSPIVRSHFVALLLTKPDVPAPNHGHVILRDAKSAPDLTVGPVLVYQLCPNETRMLVDVPGKLPSAGSGALKQYLEKNVRPNLPSSIIPSFDEALESTEQHKRLRSMPNSFLPPARQGLFTSTPSGAFMVGDALNMRHPLTGGGMSVALNDVVILTELLGGGQRVGDIPLPEEGVVDLDDEFGWDVVRERLDEWHWKRKGVASVINILAQALYSLFGADDDNLEVLKEGCFKYFELGGECVGGPVRLLSALAPSPLLLIYHFFAVALYSIYLLFTQPRSGAKHKPSPAQWPGLAVQSIQVFWTACVVIGPVLWSEVDFW